jgi:hypothetical protein
MVGHFKFRITLGSLGSRAPDIKLSTRGSQYIPRRIPLQTRDRGGLDENWGLNDLASADMSIPEFNHAQNL